MLSSKCNGSSVCKLLYDKSSDFSLMRPLNDFSFNNRILLYEISSHNKLFNFLKVKSGIIAMALPSKRNTFKFWLLLNVS